MFTFASLVRLKSKSTTVASQVLNAKTTDKISILDPKDSLTDIERQDCLTDSEACSRRPKTPDHGSTDPFPKTDPAGTSRSSEGRDLERADPDAKARTRTPRSP